MKKLLAITAALVAAVAVWGSLAMPPRRLTLTARPDGTIAGIIHVHTDRSDGLSGPDDIAAIAAHVGLGFVVFTDHGDGTRAPDPPTYRSGVLCLDGVEISTTGGHYIALDMSASPYPLGGEARDVVQDVRRLGGFGIVAHPDSPKPQLQWREWTAPFDAMELFDGKRIDQLVGTPEEPGAYLDWVALIDRGRRVTFTGNSDSHTFSSEPGYPRNMVASAPDADLEALNGAILAGRVIVMAGPYLRVELRGEGGAVAGVGAIGRPGTLHVEVDAAPFVDVETVRVLERGVTELARFTQAAGQIAPGPAARRLVIDVPITPAADTWFLVEAKSDRPMTPVYGDPPLTMTNPIFVDVGGDGWTPPLR